MKTAGQIVDTVIRPEIRAMGAYSVADAAGMIKLDVMESPYALPDWLAREIGDIVARLPLNRYPVPSLTRLRALIAATMGVPAGCDVLCGNGSDECIQYITAACAREGAVVMAPAPSFVMFQMHALFYRLQFVPVTLRPDFSLDADAFIDAMARHRPSLVWIAYPNNPTGSPFAAADIERIVRAAPGLVVVDEAYQPFAADSFMPRLAEFPNLAVMRTVSKISMAGVRLGYVGAAPEWIREFDKTRAPYNISVLAEAVAIKILENKHVIDEQAARVLAERKVVSDALSGLRGLTQFPSAANFICVRIDGPPGAGTAVFDGMRRRGVLVKNFSGGHPLLQNCLRLTIGTPEENRAMLAALSASLG
ncbi:MAG: histidinol-phosphate transaminase [Burkholderiales bacterium]|nr:histidinol-phosphate transaminase [Burkholderiales bacterium]